LVFANVGGPGYGSLTVVDGVMRATTVSSFTATVTSRNRLVLTNADSTLSAGNDIYLTANLETGAQSWRFGSNGSLGLPQLGQVTNNGQVWNFRNDGVLVTPSGIYVPSGDSSLGLTFSSDRTSSMGRISVDNSNNMTVNSTSDYSVKVSSYDRVYISNNTTTVMAGQDLVLKSNKNATEQVWTFGANGNVTIAGNINFANGRNILSSISSIGNITVSGSDITGTGTNVTITADTTDYVFYANGILALPTAGRINFNYLSISSDANVSAFYAPAGNVQLAAGIGDAQIVANSLIDSKTWTFAADGRTTFPATAVPVHSYGALGDKAGMVVLDADYIYYCKSNFVGHTSSIVVNSDQWNNNVGLITSLPFLSTARVPEVGWTISINFNSGSTTLTITGVTSLGANRYQVDFNSVGSINVSNGNSGTLIDSTPVADIWVRTVWTDTNW
jgi:hypothetical protein